MLVINEPRFPSPLKRQGYEKNKVQGFPARAVVMNAGDKPECLYRVVEGWAATCRFLDDGKRQVTGLYLPGDHFDPGWIVRPSVLQSSIALTPLTLRCFTFSDLREGDRADREGHWWAETVRSMAIQTEWLVNLGKRSALEKLAHLFCELQMRAVGGDEAVFDFPLTQVDLADICGMTSVHINRTLQQMRNLRLIELNHRQLEILDRKALEQLCGFDPAYLSTV